MAKYFRVTIESNLQSTFSVVYSTNSNPTSFDHTADIWSETTPYVAATNLTYLQLTDNGGLVVVTDDDVYQIKIEDENDYCNDCTSTAYGVAQVIYSLGNIRFDYEVDAMAYEEDNIMTPGYDESQEHYTSLGSTPNYPCTYSIYSAQANPQHYTFSPVSPITSGNGQSGNNIIIFDPSNGYDLAGDGNLWYSLSGSTGYSGNSDLSGNVARTSDLAIGINNSDIDYHSYFFSWDEVQNLMVYLSFTAYFPTGTNVTMSAVYATGNPTTGLDGNWSLDSVEVSESGTTGVWNFASEGSDGYFDSGTGNFFAKPVIKLGS
jgi:hypothetical protein